VPLFSGRHALDQLPRSLVASRSRARDLELAGEVLQDPGVLVDMRAMLCAILGLVPIRVLQATTQVWWFLEHFNNRQ
jgi:hypothetical protein